MGTLVRTKIREAVAYQLHSIQRGVDDGQGYVYRNTIAAVYDPPRSMEQIQSANFPCVNLYWGRESDNGDRLAGNNPLLDLVINGEIHCFTQSTENQSLATDTLVGDVQACFGQNFTIPGADGQSTAFVCWFKYSEAFSTDVASPSAVVVMGLEIRYRIRINQPEIAA